jgi:hypothetical protein
VEEVSFTSPYNLITAGNSLHWMDWPVVMPRFGELLSPQGVLAIVELGSEPAPWQEALREIFRRYSTNPGFQAFNLIDELTRRGLFDRRGQQRSASAPFEQPVEAYIESFHARSSFSRQRMTPDASAAFDWEVGDLVRQYTQGAVRLQVYAGLTWGIPHGAPG